MIKAIRRTLPGRDHRVCSWHIEKNMKKHLHFSYLKLFRSFISLHHSTASTTAKSVGKTVFLTESRGVVYMTCAQLMSSRRSGMVQLISTEQKRTSNGLKEYMYRKRSLWAAVFLCDRYFMGMGTNQRS